MFGVGTLQSTILLIGIICLSPSKTFKNQKIAMTSKSKSCDQKVMIGRGGTIPIVNQRLLVAYYSHRQSKALQPFSCLSLDFNSGDLYL